MANKPKVDYTGLDAFLANAGYKAPVKEQSKPRSNTKPNNEAANETLAKARQDATDAAARLQISVGQYKMGALTKEELNKEFSDYSKLQDTLYTMDAPTAQSIQQQYFPNPANAQTNTQGTPPPATGPDQYGNINGVAPTIVTDAKGNPVKNPDGSYKTAIGATEPGTGGNVLKGPTAAAGSKGSKAENVDNSGLVFTPTKGMKPSDVMGPLSETQIASQYGAMGSYALTIPWMKSLMLEGANKGWDANMFASKVQNYTITDPTTGNVIKPWDQINGNLRNSSLAYFQNAQQWAMDYNAALKNMRASAIRQGEDPSVFGNPIDVNDSKNIDAAFKDTASAASVYFNHNYGKELTGALLDQYVSNHTTFAKTDGGVYGGTLGTNANSLRQYAGDMGVAAMYLPQSTKNGPNTGDYFGNAAKAIQDGTTTYEEQQNYIKAQASAIYKPYAARIAEGMSIRALASPYLNAAQNTMEVGADQIDLGASTGLGSLVTKAMQGDGNSSVPLDQYITRLKQQPDWLNTSNARNSLMDTATSMLRNFGMVVG